MKTQKQIIGDLGEGIACNYLKNKAFNVTDKNYWKPWGEIDIVAKNKGIIHFIEVKTVSRENLEDVIHETNGKIKHKVDNNVNHETFEERYRAEDNLHPWKLKRLSRVIQSYLLSKSVSPETIDWQFDVVVVYLDVENRKARVKYMEDIIL